MSDGPSNHDRRGRFAPGNQAWRNRARSDARRVAALRSAAIKAVTADDVAAIMVRLVTLARDGNVPAAKEVLQRLLGPATEIDLQGRLSELEDAIGQMRGMK